MSRAISKQSQKVKTGTEKKEFGSPKHTDICSTSLCMHKLSARTAQELSQANPHLSPTQLHRNIGTNKMDHCKSAHESSPPASHWSSDRYVAPPSLKCEPKVGKHCEASRCNSKESRGKALTLGHGETLSLLNLQPQLRAQPTSSTETAMVQNHMAKGSCA